MRTGPAPRRGVDARQNTTSEARLAHLFTQASAVRSQLPEHLQVVFEARWRTEFPNPSVLASLDDEVRPVLEYFRDRVQREGGAA